MSIFEHIADNFSKIAFSMNGNIDKEKELELVKKIQKQNDVMALRQLKHSLKPLVNKIVQTVKPSNSDASESKLEFEADIALTKLLKSYDPDKAQLNTYIYNNLPGLLKNVIRESYTGAHVPRPDRVKLEQLQFARREAEAEHGFNPSDEQVFSFVKGTKLENDWDEFQRIKQYDVKNFIGDATHSASDEGDSVQFKDLFQQDFTVDKEDELNSLKLDRLRNLAKQKLDPQEYKIVEETLFGGKSRTQAALSLGLASSQIKKAIDKWFKIVKDENLHI